jgi:hypothetical protein
MYVMPKANIDAYFAGTRESLDEVENEAKGCLLDPFSRHKWVKLAGLKTTELNGRLAEIVLPPNEEDRFGVRISSPGEILTHTVKLIKRSNLEAIPDSETTRVCRLSTRAESSFPGSLIQSTRWPQSVLGSLPYDVSPVSKLLGFPLHITRVPPRSTLSAQSDFDNQWVTWMMIEPVR